MKKVTGIGGIFFKCKDTAKMKDWYAKNLGFPTNEWGTMFEWQQADERVKNGVTTWSTFPENTTHFEPSTKDYMINYRVENIDDLVEQLKSDGITIVDEVVTYAEYGKFVHILDPEGNKIELWEPVDEG